ncbi:MAG: polysaccharide deacetylase family protein, partial [Abditibacteriaceae bacterium]
MKKLQQFQLTGFVFLIACGCVALSPLSMTQASDAEPAKVLSPPSHAKMTIPDWAQGKVVNSVKLEHDEKAVALTFDDGPWPKYTHQILSILKKQNIKATFFMVGSELAKRPQVGRDVVAAGMVVGNHSW